MADAFVGLDEAATIDKRVDCESLIVGADTVFRQRFQLAGTGATQIAPVDSVHGVRVDQGTITTFGRITTADANAVNVKASAGNLRSVHVFNRADYPIYVKFHNTAGTPTAGSGVVFRVAVQAGQQRDVALPGRGRAFTTGIAMTVVTDITDAGTAAVALNDAVIEVVHD